MNSNQKDIIHMTSREKFKMELISLIDSALMTQKEGEDFLPGFVKYYIEWKRESEKKYVKEWVKHPEMTWKEFICSNYAGKVEIEIRRTSHVAKA